MSRHANVAVFVPHAGCTHACSFCNQHTISGTARMPTPAEVTALLIKAAQSLDREKKAQIAFFGGSFTAIERETMAGLLAAAQPFVESGKFAGIRISTRPDCVGDEVLDVLEAHHVTDIELGVQSMDDAVLSANWRGHTAVDVAMASAKIKARGFALGHQMMTGLYRDTAENALSTARKIAALSPGTVRIYPTLTLRGTPLAELYAAGEYAPPTLDETVELCSDLLDFFTGQGIPVIRLGLHDSVALAEDIVAGAHHPALRELCESHILINKALIQLQDRQPGNIILSVNSRSVSKMAGQHRANLLELERLGYIVRIHTDNTLDYLEVVVT